MAWMRFWRRQRTVAPAWAGLPPASELPSSQPAPDPVPDEGASTSVLEAWDHRGAYLRWLLQWPELPRRPDPQAGERALAAIDAAAANRESWGKLVGRAPNVVPRLLNSLRSLTYSRAEVAQHIERDALLTAEVLRLARSSLYAHVLRGRPPTVGHAIDLLGSTGLQDVIARVLLHPLFATEGQGLRSRAAARLQDESERCARLATALAAAGGVDAVEAYLAGLLHNIGWSAVLRALELQRLDASMHRGLFDDAAFVAALFARRDRLLGRVVVSWSLSPQLTALARCLSGDELSWPPLQLVQANAQELLVLRRLQLLGTVPGGLMAPRGLPAQVQHAYLAD